MELPLTHLLYVVIVNMSIILVGYALARHRLFWLSWALLGLSVFVIHLIFAHDYPVLHMLALIATAFLGMKVLATAAYYRGKRFGLSFFQWVVFAIAWAGMRAQLFEKLGGKPLPDAWPKIGFGVSRMAAGALLIFLAHRLVELPLPKGLLFVLISALLLVAFSLILHFGLLSIGAGLWRLFGVNVSFLFRAPWKAKSLQEFWSERWNIAFSEMTAVVVYKPLKDRVGAAAALLLAFLFSGLLHELALCVPVGRGYGLPLLYFVIQSFVILLEKKLSSLKPSFLQHGLRSRLWVCCWLVLPLPLLFSADFIREVIWPIAGLSGM